LRVLLVEQQRQMVEWIQATLCCLTALTVLLGSTRQIPGKMTALRAALANMSPLCKAS
jgi:hypothetical protein